jgi:hypothetical protein
MEIQHFGLCIGSLPGNVLLRGENVPQTIPIYFALNKFLQLNFLN